MTDPVYIHLKNINRDEDIVLKQVVDLQVGADGGPLGVEDEGLDVGDVADAYRCLSNAEITDERISVGGRHMVQGPGYCGEYYERKRARKE